jgi:RHS repeat-associated protein
VTNDGVNNYAYDGENRLKSVGGGAITYSYDGAGRMIKRTTASVSTYYLYGQTGLLSEFTTASGYTVTAAASTDRLTYYLAEPTGTPVILMASSGAIVENNRVFPYGESWSTLSSTNEQKYTTYLRDSDTLLDYAMARYYASGYGRFLSPDPILGNLYNPQSWNRYTYVLNDSINFIDPTGLYYVCDYSDRGGSSDPCEGHISGGGGGAMWDGENILFPWLDGLTGASDEAAYEAGLEFTRALNALNQALGEGYAVLPSLLQEDPSVKLGTVCKSKNLATCLEAFTRMQGIRPGSIRQSAQYPGAITFDITDQKALTTMLANNPVVYRGNLGGMHSSEVGRPNIDFRTSTSFGVGSYQIVVGTNRGYMDRDRFNSYQSPIDFLLHGLIEVIPGFFR